MPDVGEVAEDGRRRLGPARAAADERHLARGQVHRSGDVEAVGSRLDFEIAKEKNVLQFHANIERVSVNFRELGDDEIARYIATGEPMDKAGAYGIQGYGATIVRRIEGDYFAVMGLSLVRLVELLVQIGVRYTFAK